MLARVRSNLTITDLLRAATPGAAEPIERGAARHEQRQAEKKPGTDHGFGYGFFGSETVVCPRFPKSITTAPAASTPTPNSAPTPVYARLE